MNELEASTEQRRGVILQLERRLEGSASREAVAEELAASVRALEDELERARTQVRGGEGN